MYAVFAFMSIWGGLGYNVLIMLSAMKNIDPSLYEAAEIDGAGAVQKFLYITVPGVMPTVFFFLITGLISGFQVGEQMLIIYGDTTMVNSIYTYVYGMYYVMRRENNFAVASAMSYFLFIIILVSMKQAVRISAASRRTERAELAVLGMGRNSAALVFALSFLIVLAVSLAAGFLLSLISLPLAQAAVQGIFAGAELAMPYRHFAVLAALMVLMTAAFSAAIEARERRIDIMEVLSDE